MKQRQENDEVVGIKSRNHLSSATEHVFVSTRYCSIKPRKNLASQRSQIHPDLFVGAHHSHGRKESPFRNRNLPHADNFAIPGEKDLEIQAELGVST